MNEEKHARKYCEMIALYPSLRLKEKNGLTFEAWFKEVDKEVFKITGAIGVDDLADCYFWDMWNDEMMPRDGAWEALSRDDIGQMMIAGEYI